MPIILADEDMGEFSRHGSRGQVVYDDECQCPRCKRIRWRNEWRMIQAEGRRKMKEA
jgi:hypothetical protein